MVLLESVTMDKAPKSKEYDATVESVLSLLREGQDSSVRKYSLASFANAVPVELNFFGGTRGERASVKEALSKQQLKPPSKKSTSASDHNVKSSVGGKGNSSKKNSSVGSIRQSLSESNSAALESSEKHASASSHNINSSVQGKGNSSKKNSSVGSSRQLSSESNSTVYKSSKNKNSATASSNNINIPVQGKGNSFKRNSPAGSSQQLSSESNSSVLERDSNKKCTSASGHNVNSSEKGKGHSSKKNSSVASTRPISTVLDSSEIKDCASSSSHIVTNSAKGKGESSKKNFAVGSSKQLAHQSNSTVSDSSQISRSAGNINRKHFSTPKELESAAKYRYMTAKKRSGICPKLISKETMALSQAGNLIVTLGTESGFLYPGNGNDPGCGSQDASADYVSQSKETVQKPPDGNQNNISDDPTCSNKSNSTSSVPPLPVRVIQTVDKILSQTNNTHPAANISGNTELSTEDVDLVKFERGVNDFSQDCDKIPSKESTQAKSVIVSSESTESAKVDDQGRDISSKVNSPTYPTPILIQPVEEMNDSTDHSEKQLAESEERERDKTLCFCEISVKSEDDQESIKVTLATDDEDSDCDVSKIPDAQLSYKSDEGDGPKSNSVCEIRDDILENNSHVYRNEEDGSQNNEIDAKPENILISDNGSKDSNVSNFQKDLFLSWLKKCKERGIITVNSETSLDQLDITWLTENTHNDEQFEHQLVGKNKLIVPTECCHCSAHGEIEVETSCKHVKKLMILCDICTGTQTSKNELHVSKESNSGSKSIHPRFETSDELDSVGFDKQPDHVPTNSVSTGESINADNAYQDAESVKRRRRFPGKVMSDALSNKSFKPIPDGGENKKDKEGTEKGAESLSGVTSQDARSGSNVTPEQLSSLGSCPDDDDDEEEEEDDDNFIIIEVDSHTLSGKEINGAVQALVKSEYVPQVKYLNPEVQTVLINKILSNSWTATAKKNAIGKIMPLKQSMMFYVKDQEQTKMAKDFLVRSQCWKCNRGWDGSVPFKCSTNTTLIKMCRGCEKDEPEVGKVREFSIKEGTDDANETVSELGNHSVSCLDQTSDIEDSDIDMVCSVEQNGIKQEVNNTTKMEIDLEVRDKMSPSDVLGTNRTPPVPVYTEIVHSPELLQTHGEGCPLNNPSSDSSLANDTFCVNNSEAENSTDLEHGIKSEDTEDIHNQGIGTAGLGEEVIQSSDVSEQCTLEGSVNPMSDLIDVSSGKPNGPDMTSKPDDNSSPSHQSGTEEHVPLVSKEGSPSLSEGSLFDGHTETSFDCNEKNKTETKKMQQNPFVPLHKIGVPNSVRNVSLFLRKINDCAVCSKSKVLEQPSQDSLTKNDESLITPSVSLQGHSSLTSISSPARSEEFTDNNVKSKVKRKFDDEKELQDIGLNHAKRPQTSISSVRSEEFTDCNVESKLKRKFDDYEKELQDIGSNHAKRPQTSVSTARSEEFTDCNVKSKVKRKINNEEKELQDTGSNHAKKTQTSISSARSEEFTDSNVKSRVKRKFNNEEKELQDIGSSHAKRPRTGRADTSPGKMYPIQVKCQLCGEVKDLNPQMLAAVEVVIHKLCANCVGVRRKKYNSYPKKASVTETSGKSNNSGSSQMTPLVSKGRDAGVGKICGVSKMDNSEREQRESDLQQLKQTYGTSIERLNILKEKVSSTSSHDNTDGHPTSSIRFSCWKCQNTGYTTINAESMTNMMVQKLCIYCLFKEQEKNNLHQEDSACGYRQWNDKSSDCFSEGKPVPLVSRDDALFEQAAIKPCRYCGVRHKTYQGMIHHKWVIHSERSCQECHKTFISSAQLELHSKLHLSTNKDFCCGICGEKSVDFVHHLFEVHKHHKCYICGLNLLNGDGFDQSVRKHFEYHSVCKLEKGNKQCPVYNCGFEFTSLDLYLRHMWMYHHKRSCLICCDDKTEFSTLQALFRHISRHMHSAVDVSPDDMEMTWTKISKVVCYGTTNVTCSHCDMMFSSLLRLTKHQWLFHEKSLSETHKWKRFWAPFQVSSVRNWENIKRKRCLVCGELKQSLTELSEHLWSFHACYRCIICQELVNSACDLKQHLEEFCDEVQRGKKMFVGLICPELHCNYSGNSVSSLLEHMWLEHKIDQCLICDQKCALPKHMLYHIVMHQCENINDPKTWDHCVKDVLLAYDDNVQEKCLLCSFVSPSFEITFLHMWNDHGLRTCLFCKFPLMYATHHSLANHMSEHSKEELYAFQCSFCEKSFMLQTDLIEHSFDQHSVKRMAKPFNCTICELPLRDLSDMQEHLQSCAQIRYPTDKNPEEITLAYGKSSGHESSEKINCSLSGGIGDREKSQMELSFSARSENNGYEKTGSGLATENINDTSSDAQLSYNSDGGDVECDLMSNDTPDVDIELEMGVWSEENIGSASCNVPSLGRKKGISHNESLKVCGFEKMDDKERHERKANLIKLRKIDGRPMKKCDIFLKDLKDHVFSSSSACENNSDEDPTSAITYQCWKCDDFGSTKINARITTNTMVYKLCNFCQSMQKENMKQDGYAAEGIQLTEYQDGNAGMASASNQNPVDSIVIDTRCNVRDILFEQAVIVACEICGWCPETYQEMIHHKWTQHSERSCIKCQKTFISSAQLVLHSKLHMARKELFSCRMCGGKTTDILYHLFTVHRHNRCYICGENFLNGSRFDRGHFECHLFLKLEKGDKQCPVYNCAFEFTSLDLYLRHMWKYHQEKACHVCCNSMVFSTLDAFLRHFSTHMQSSVDVKPEDLKIVKENMGQNQRDNVIHRICSCCNQSFVSLSKLMNHQWHYRERSLYQTSQCRNLVFCYQQDNTTHLICSYCNLRFSTLLKLTKHQWLFHKRFLSETFECQNFWAPFQLSNARHLENLLKNRCLVCGILKQSLSELAEHLWTIHGCRQCIVCEEVVSKSCDLEQHLEEFMDKIQGKPQIIGLICPQLHCHYRGKSVFSLLEHMWSEHKIDQCLICDQKCVLPKHMLYHIIMHQCENIENPKTWEHCVKDVQLKYNDNVQEKCPLCSFVSPSFEITFLHMWDDHGLRTCLFCKRPHTNVSLHALADHLASHRNNKVYPFQCSFCNKSFMLESVLVEHSLIEHGIKQTAYPFKCTKCKLPLKNLSNIQEHLQICSKKYNRMTKCSHCDWVGLLGGNLLNHMEISHPKETMQCEENGQSCSNQGKQQHVRIHFEGQHFKCQQCGKKYKQRRSYITHMHLHTADLPFVCELCGKDFSSSEKLAEHKKNIH